MESDWNKPREASSEEYPQNATKNGGVLRNVCRTKEKQDSIQREGDGIKAVLTIECRVGHCFCRDFCSQQGVSSQAEHKMQRSDDEENRGQELENKHQWAHAISSTVLTRSGARLNSNLTKRGTAVP
jgi:hypothetical protein